MNNFEITEKKLSTNNFKKLFQIIKEIANTSAAYKTEAFPTII